MLASVIFQIDRKFFEPLVMYALFCPGYRIDSVNSNENSPILEPDASGLGKLTIYTLCPPEMLTKVIVDLDYTDSRAGFFIKK